MEVIEKDKTVGILVVDGRQTYMADILKKKGYRVTTWKQQDGDMGDADVIILPVPIHKVKNQAWLQESIEKHRDRIQICFGGVFPDTLIQLLDKYEISRVDVLKDRDVARKNAIATAEGTIAELCKIMPVNMEGANIIVMGFGNCGKPIAEKLYCMGTTVSVVARSEKARSLAHYFGFRDYPMDAEIPYASADAIVNTVPAPVITQKEIDQLREDAVIVDIASRPGGCDFAYCEKRGIRYKHALGLPGIYSPKTSGEILLEAMPFGYKPPKEKWMS